MKKIFIDGKAGTTGLRIYERLSQRNDIEMILLSEEERKLPEARRRALNSCDIRSILFFLENNYKIPIIINKNNINIKQVTSSKYLKYFLYLLYFFI
jgi:N-acetyl-gamma-glutamylphosphate reductase